MNKPDVHDQQTDDLTDADVTSQADDPSNGEANDDIRVHTDLASAGEPETASGEVPREDLSAEDADTPPPLTTEQLQTLLTQARGEADAERENTLRAKAEMENLRRRATRDVENAHKFGIERFVNELLPVVDSLELGLQASEQEGATIESLREGGALTLKMFLAAMEKFDVEVVDPLEQPFDPEFHQAMSMQEVEGKDAGTVLQVFQKGYLLNGRLVRPAMVIVSK